MLPTNATQLQDLIEYQDMNANQKECFKASWRVGRKEGNDSQYDWKKIVYFSLRELGRIQGHKDYLALAEQIIGDQSETKTSSEESIEATTKEDGELRYGDTVRGAKERKNAILFEGIEEARLQDPVDSHAIICDGGHTNTSLCNRNGLCSNELHSDKEPTQET